MTILLPMIQLNHPHVSMFQLLNPPLSWKSPVVVIFHPFSIAIIEWSPPWIRKRLPHLSVATSTLLGDACAECEAHFLTQFLRETTKTRDLIPKSRIPKNGTLKCENERLYGVVYFRTHISMSNKLCFNNQPRNSLIINNKCQKNGCSQAKKMK